MQMHAQEQFTADPLEMLSACSKVCRGPAKERIETLINTMAMLQLFELSQDVPKQ